MRELRRQVAELKQRLEQEVLEQDRLAKQYDRAEARAGDFEARLQRADAELAAREQHDYELNVSLRMSEMF